MSRNDRFSGMATEQCPKIQLVWEYTRSIFAHFALTPWDIPDQKYVDHVVALAQKGSDFSVPPFRPGCMRTSGDNIMKSHKNQWIMVMSMCYFVSCSAAWWKNAMEFNLRSLVKDSIYLSSLGTAPCNLLNKKSFHGAFLGSSHGYWRKSCYGKVRG